MQITRRALVLSLLATPLSPVVSHARGLNEREEALLWQQAAAAISARYHVVENAEVSRVGLGLAAASKHPKLPWTFQVIDTPDVSAVSLPGGQVYLYAGLLRRVSTDEGLLAAALGHEIGHVEMRDAVRQIQRAQWGGVEAELLRQPVEGSAAAGALAANLERLRFSDAQESEADETAIHLMQRTKRNPEALVRLLQLLRRLGEGTEGPGWLRTHPITEARVERARQQIAASR